MKKKSQLKVIEKAIVVRELTKGNIATENMLDSKFIMMTMRRNNSEDSVLILGS